MVNRMRTPLLALLTDCGQDGNTEPIKPDIIKSGPAAPSASIYSKGFVSSGDQLDDLQEKNSTNDGL